MIGYLKGIAQVVQPDWIVILIGGVGYVVRTSGQLIEEGSEVELFIHTQVKQDDIVLWGFSSRAELEMFSLLIGVSGVGAKTASQMLFTCGADGVMRAVQQEDPLQLKAPGVGAKTAERVVLELRDKLGKLANFSKISDTAGSKPKGSNSLLTEQVVQAMVSLGYKEAEVRRYVAGLDTAKFKDSQEIIKELLKVL